MLSDQEELANKGQQTEEFEREFVAGRKNKISMIWKGRLPNANTAPGAFTCIYMETETLTMDCPTQILGVDSQGLQAALPCHRKPGWEDHPA